MKPVAALVFVLCATAASGQAIDPLLSKYAFLDYAAPEVNAGSLLSLTPDKVIRPGSTRELFVQLLNAASLSGTALPGLGLEVNPFLLINRDRSVDSLPTLWQGVSFSLAWKPDSAGNRFATGIKWTFADENAISAGQGVDSLLRIVNKKSLKALRSAAPAREAVADYVDDEREEIGKSRPNEPVRDSLDVLSGNLLNGLSPKSAETIATFVSRLDTLDVAAYIDEQLKLVGLDQPGVLSPTFRDSLVAVYTRSVMSVLGDVYTPAYQDEQRSLIQQAREEYLRSRWSASAAAIGFGSTFRSMQTAGMPESSLTAETVTGYVTASLRLGASVLATGMVSGQLAFQAGQGLRPEQMATGAIQILYGSNDLRATMSAACHYAQYSDTYQDMLRRGAKGGEGRCSVGIEARIGTELWAFANVGPEWRLNVPKALWTADYGLRYAPTIDL